MPVFESGCLSIRMFSPKREHLIAFVIVAAGLSSCANLERPAKATVLSTSPNQRYFGTSPDQLLTYGAQLSRLARVDLLAECNKVRELYQASRQAGVLLHLFMAQMASGACGDLANTTGLIRELRATLKDEWLEKYLAFQMLIAERTIADSAERDDLATRFREAQGRLKKAKSTLLQAQRQVQAQRRTQSSKERMSYQEFHERLKSRDAELKSRDAEARQLKQKLDALKSIEEDLDGIERQDNHD